MRRARRCDGAVIGRARAIVLGVVLLLGMTEVSWALEKRVVNAPPRAADPGKGTAVRLRVTERSGTACADHYLVTGLPFAAGALDPSSPLRVTDGPDILPVASDVLARWPDGSVRWARLRTLLPLGAGETKELRVIPGDGSEPHIAQPDLPEMSLDVVTLEGTTRIDLTACEFTRHGNIGIETDVEPLGARRATVRFTVAQMDRDATWSNLIVHVASPGPARPGTAGTSIGRGEWCAAVFRAVERGPVACTFTPRGFDVNLLVPPGTPLAADRGFHVTYEIVVERSKDPDDLARRVNLPLRATLPGSYVDDTRAMGRVGAPDRMDSGLEAGFLAGWDRLREQQQSEPGNRGALAWGDFLDRRSGLAYAGYLNQEYDPAVAFFVHHARTGDSGALDLALDMARQYADACTGLHGGNYQHRATLEALEDQVALWVAGGLEREWRNGGDPATPDEIIAYIGGHYGETAARFARTSLASAEVQAMDPVAREAYLAHLFAYELIVNVREDLAKDPEAAQRVGERVPDLRAYAELLLGHPFVRKFGSPDLAGVFQPFFARYGGSWSDFPAFHFYNLPSEARQHDASHSLVEMLVLGYSWTGDPSLRRAALRVARYHVESNLVRRAVDNVSAQVRNGRPCTARDAGWAMINLLALETITEGMEPELHGRIERAIEELRGAILAIPPRAYAGPLHLGIVGEALARDHARYGSPRVLSHLKDTYRFWCEERWDRGSSSFRSADPGEGDASLPVTGLCLYGLAHTATETGDPLLARTAREALRGLSAVRPSSAKSLAQAYRGSLRAAVLLDQPDGLRKAGR